MNTGRLTWIGGEHDFALDIGALRALQASCDAGPEQILQRLRKGEWRVDDVIEPIRLGLITAKEMTAPEARDFIAMLFNQNPILQFRPLALTILMSALLGQEDDPVGEDEGAEASPENGNLVASTETAE